MDAWQLRAVGGRAVLVAPDDPEHGVAPRSLTIDDELAGALDEWAGVTEALPRANPVSARLISRRGRQLAARLAAATGRVITFTDPRDGTQVVLDGRAGGGAAEPTPWATGLGVTACALGVTVFGMVALALTLAEVSEWLALVGNVASTVGLSPTIGVLRGQLVWRWVAYGLVAGLVIGWLVWFCTL